MDGLSSKEIAAIRQDYVLSALTEAATGDDPVSFFKGWFQEAINAAVQEPNAFALSTVSYQGSPHSRIVLLKGIEEEGFVFFTNYESAKGSEMDTNNQVALLFFWPELQRQVRIEGTVQKVSVEYTQAYFKSRPRGSQVGAWASPQSRLITSRAVIEERERDIEERYEGQDIPCPAHWGGYAVAPKRMEFWQGRSNRLHDRICFEKQVDGWAKMRLAP